MRIALATYAQLPDWETDDRHLEAAFARAGVSVESVSWDRPDIRWGDYGGVLIRSTWDYHDRLGEFLAWVESTAAETTLLHGPGVVRWNTHKGYLDELGDLGCPVTPTERIPVGDVEALGRILGERAWGRALLKPIVGANADGTLRFVADAEGLRNAERHVAGPHTFGTFLLQPYLEAVEQEGELSAIFLDGGFSHGVRKVPARGDFRVQEDFGARHEPHNFGAEEIELCEGILARAEAALDSARGSALGSATDSAKGERGEREERLLYARVDLIRGPSGGLLLNELELVEPSLYLRQDPSAADRLARAFLARLP